MKLTYKTFQLKSNLLAFVNDLCTLPDDLVSVAYEAGVWVLWYWEKEEASQ